MYFLNGQSLIKGTLLSKSHTFLRYKILIRDVINLCLGLFEDVTDDYDLRKINLKSFVLIGLFVIATQ